MSSLTIEGISLYSVVLRGDTTGYEEELKQLGGQWIELLKNGPGWIFPVWKLDELESFVDDIQPGNQPDHQ
jgi:hypothetical protein